MTRRMKLERLIGAYHEELDKISADYDRTRSEKGWMEAACEQVQRENEARATLITYIEYVFEEEAAERAGEAQRAGR